MKESWATAERLAQARQHYRCCTLCEHRCGIDRQAGQRGPCKAGPGARVFRHRIEYSEEAQLVPSHLFYLSGCDLRCVFCIAERNAFDPGRGQPLTPDLFQKAVAWGAAQGARTLQWVGGEPTIHLPVILEVMAACSALPPIVWKSDFHGTPEALALLDGVVDDYVADFKFGNDACARRLSGINGYLSIVTRNLVLASQLAKKGTVPLSSRGQSPFSQAGLIIRHLLLPGHFDCCYRPLVHWIQGHLPDVPFSLRDGYLPYWQARRHADLSKPLDREQGERARELAAQAGLRLIY
jgi:putative pyruvate formate lyase activating enzyme